VDRPFNKAGEEQSVIVSGRIRVNAAEGLREAVLAHQGLTMPRNGCSRRNWPTVRSAK
jgi:hypothetical protein